MTESVEVVFSRNGWLATGAELAALGVSRAVLRRWVRTGEVTAVARAIYAPTEWLKALAGDPRQVHAVAAGALIRRNRGLIASHESAAYLHGLDLLMPSSDKGAATPEVAMTRRPQEASRSLVHGATIRVATLPDDHVTTALGVPVTTVARTVMDIARTRGVMAGVVTADSALRNRTSSKGEFSDVLDSCAQWPGVVRARRVVAFADGRAESVLESVARVRFAQFGVKAPSLQVSIWGPDAFAGRADFCWHEYRTVAEADGAVKYTPDRAREQARAQLARDERFHDAGWGTFHFTWREIYHEPAPTIERLHRAFARNRKDIPISGRTNGDQGGATMTRTRYTSSGERT